MTTSRYPCLCALIRKAGRIVTRNYDNWLKPSGLKVTQLGMLAKIAGNPSITVSELAESLVMDQTTVSRNLRVLEKSGYIHLEAEMADHRIRRIQISDFGVSRMNEAIPLWEKAQLDMERVLGREGVELMMKTFKKLTG
ncbi:MAG TPA: MarR family winged helix-turn-helix transcriptional regulator [Syntrophobacteraceae bacterium]|nr:MarR family winged helix-turn-helix transcriptional regulator [Syntrophobacteraceae bacterium]